MKTELIRQKALKIGLDVVGFTYASSLTRVKRTLDDRYMNGLKTEFEIDEISKRIEPKLIMENSKSIIVVGFPYFSNIKHTENSIYGKISMSSWGLDYHIVIRKYLKQLVEELLKIESFEYKILSDTTPLIDREIAYKAGIGYYGKNTNIINDTYGSFIFIGYIITDLLLDIYSLPVESKCDECDLCLRSCPGKAIEQPYKINPMKCISYLSQTKKYLTEEESKIMGKSIYGCDICQIVCPKNKNIKESNFIEFKPYKTNGVVDIKELLLMSKREFDRKYGDMAGSWRGKNVLTRNAIIALDNMGYIDDDIRNSLKNIDSEFLRPYITRYLSKF
ncbi:MAG: tRNA epoxyqueuosine(34) reductase QueG [Tissierellales bacterium]|nr:tRNA epoxyqueuosine(34) reductase QueG [Tissierellales bacterium]